MKLLTTNQQTASAFEELCSKYNHYEFTVAWAGNPYESKVAKLLKSNEGKIKKMVVGLHFYQTSPEFIKQYKNNHHVRFYLDDTSEVFHPKVYLFYNDASDWSVIIGSSNFTNGGFYKNTEANVLIESSDGDRNIFKDLLGFIDRTWNSAREISNAELKAYEECFRYQKPNIKSLSKVRSSKVFDTTEMDLMTWDSYVSKVQHSEGIDERIELLDIAHEIFKTHKHFDDIDGEVKKCLCGYKAFMPGDDEKKITWLWFGSMKGAGDYKHSINSNSIISKAIDSIPLEGKVSQKQFDDYCKAFTGWKNPLACATRLLSIKRPNLFICIDSKNKRNLCKAFGITQNSLTLSTYWDKIVRRVQDSIWFKDEADNSTPMAQKMKGYQVALLDVLYYEDK